MYTPYYGINTTPYDRQKFRCLFVFYTSSYIRLAV